MWPGAHEPFFWDVFGITDAAVSTAFLVFLVVAVVLLVRRARPARQRTSALEILEERYARGEIGRDEFIERRAVLTGDRPEAAPRP